MSQLATKGVQPYWISEVGVPLLDLDVVRERAEITGEERETALVALLREAAEQLTPSYRDLVSIVLGLDPRYLGWSASRRRTEAGKRFRGDASEPVREGTIRTYHEPRAFDALIEILVSADQDVGQEHARPAFLPRMSQAGAYVRFVDSNDQRSVALPTSQPALIGRSATAKVQIDEPWVSRLHAELAEIAGRWVIRDLGSKNGTSVNGHRVGDDPIPLTDGDVIYVGETRLVFHEASDTEIEDAYRTAPARPEVPTPTATQMKVLRELVKPLLEGQTKPASNAEIAQRLFLSAATVKTHLNNLYHLFGISPHTDRTGRRLELARRALDLIHTQ